MILSVLSGVVTSLLIIITYIWIKDINLKNHENVTDGGLPIPTFYLSLVQQLSKPRKRWGNYFIFITVVPIIFFILQVSILQKYCNIHIFLGLITTVTLSSIMRFKIIFNNKRPWSERFLLLVTFIILIILAFLISFLSKFINFSLIAPDFESLKNDMWSGLIIALLIFIYFKYTNMNYKSNNKNDSDAFDPEIKDLVYKSFYEILSRYNKEISKYCDENNCSIQLLISILINESLNRPPIFRSIENIIVKIPKIEMTVGVAQVLSNHSLSDEESIQKASEILRDTKSVNDCDLKEYIKKYNNSETYLESILKIKQLISTKYLEEYN